MSKGAVFRLLLGLIAAFWISLRLMNYVSAWFAQLVTAFRDSVGERSFFVAAIAAAAVLAWSVWDAFHHDRVTRYVDTLLIWSGAALLFHLVVVILLTVIITIAGALRSHKPEVMFFAPLFAPMALILGVPITVALIPARARILQRRRGGDASLLAADAMSSVLIILLVVWTATVGGGGRNQRSSESPNNNSGSRRMQARRLLRERPSTPMALD